MYTKKCDGVVGVELPDGTMLCQSDLPRPGDQTRWVARRKMTVVLAIKHELITDLQAMERYNLSDEELAGWMRAYEEFGYEGLKVKAAGGHKH